MKGVPSHRITVEMTVSRFWAQVQRGEPDECWPWTGYTEDGYGRFSDGERMRFAHELALTYWNGSTRPEGWDTCHRCNNPPCCNPAHLRFGTRQDNVDDMTRAGRQARGSTNGHARLTEGDVLAIRLGREAGIPIAALAAEFRTTKANITLITKGDRWKHVGGPLQQKEPANG
jgi:hypothetical protein